MSLVSASERYLTVAEVAEILGTTERFPRRLIAERRIDFVKAGKYVRIPQSVLDAYIASNTVVAIRRGGVNRTRRAA